MFMPLQPPETPRPSLAGDGQARLLTKVAHMYHEQGIRQADIARALHLSQARVSRLLKKAVDVGLVRTIVLVPPDVHPDLEQALEQKFGLLEAVVVDVEGDEQEILRGLGSAGASYLEAVLTGGERIGISSWSQTLLSVVDRLRPFKIRGADTIVQLVGGVGVSSVQAEANRLLSELARLLGASPTFVPAPGLVGTEAIRQSLLADPAMDAVAREWASLTLALVGIGSLQPSQLLRESGNAIAAPDQEKLLAAGAVGDVCHRFFTRDGQLVHSDLDTRVVGIAAESYLAVPRRIGIAGGRRKHAAVRAAIMGGWVNVVLTDVGTARALLDPEEGDRAGTAVASGRA